MKKRSKKRIPQDILPWHRVFNKEAEQLTFHTKKTVRWTSGNSRDWQTSLFIAQQKTDSSVMLLKSFYKDQITLNEGKKWRSYKYKMLLRAKLDSINKKFPKNKPKNFCLIVGRNRAYNQKLFMSRHSLRRLLRDNHLAGLIK